MEEGLVILLLGSAVSASLEAVTRPRPNLRERKIRPAAAESQACKLEKCRRRSWSVG